MIVGWLRISSFLNDDSNCAKYPDVYKQLREKHEMIIENINQLREARNKAVLLPEINEMFKFENLISREQVEEAFARAMRDERNVIADLGDCRTGKVVKIMVDKKPYVLKLPLEHTFKIELDNVISKLRNEYNVYKRLKSMYAAYKFLFN